MNHSTNASAPLMALPKTKQKEQNRVKDGLEKKRMGNSLREDQLMSKKIYDAALACKVEIFEEIVRVDDDLLWKTVWDKNLFRKTMSDTNLLRKTVRDDVWDKNLLRKTMSDTNLLRKTVRDDEDLHRKTVRNKNLLRKIMSDTNLLRKTVWDKNLLRKTMSDTDLLRKTVWDKNLLRKTMSDTNLLRKTVSDEHLLILRKTFLLNNILHVAFRSRPYHDDGGDGGGDGGDGDDDDADGDDDSDSDYDDEEWLGQKREFVHTAVSRFPRLLWERNVEGDTPLHVAAEFEGNEDFVREVCKILVSPLRMKNSMGNTPLHVALIRYQPEVAEIMLEQDPSLATIVNDSLEAPLHLAIKYFFHLVDTNDIYDPVTQRNYKEKKKLEFIKMMREKEPSWDYPADNEYEKERDNVSKEDKVKNNKKQKKENKAMKIIMELLEKASYVAGWQDASGMTPLHLAASLDTAFNLVVISYIIYCCPPSMEVCDNSGKTILHLLIHRILYLSEARDCLYKPRLHSLRDRQDHDGNTPLHLAMISKDFIMIYLIKNDRELEFHLKNKAAQSIISLMKQEELATAFRAGSQLKGIMMTEDMCRRVECGDILTLEPFLDKKIGYHYYEAKDFDGKNLLHKLFQIKQGHVVIHQRYIEFIDTLVEIYPYMLSDTDNDGETPLHILARLNPDNIMIHLATGVQDGPTHLENLYSDPKPNDPIFFTSSYKKYTYACESLGNTKFLADLLEKCHQRNAESFSQGCSTQNGKGNTPLHDAIRAENFTVFSTLAKLSAKATTLLNFRRDTALHLLASVNPIPADINDDILRNIVKHHIEAVELFGRDLLDKDGLTPLMRAIKAGNIKFAERMCSLCPRIAELKGNNGKTLWHALAISPLVNTIDVKNSAFFTSKVVRDQLKKNDDNENTALHIAIHRHNFAAAKLFLSFRTREGAKKLHEQLLEIPRKDGKTPSELIGALPYLPPDFEDFIWKDSTMIGTRSMWRIPTTRTESYVNTMGVIAALLTTITFTAAFTVPGGLIQENGTPVLISDPTFQVFMISNILAMCLSMLVLFCLLWIMATGDNSKSVVILDFSIMLLLVAFYLTLLTFMTGLYATTHLVKPWIAILTLVLCSLFLLLMLIYLVGSLVIPSRKAILIYAVKSYEYAKGLCENSISLIQKCFCPWSNSLRQEAHSSIPSNRSEAETSTFVRIERG